MINTFRIKNGKLESYSKTDKYNGSGQTSKRKIIKDDTTLGELSSSYVYVKGSPLVDYSNYISKIVSFTGSASFVESGIEKTSFTDASTKNCSSSVDITTSSNESHVAGILTKVLSPVNGYITTDSHIVESPHPILEVCIKGIALCWVILQDGASLNKGSLVSSTSVGEIVNLGSLVSIADGSTFGTSRHFASDTSLSPYQYMISIPYDFNGQTITNLGGQSVSDYSFNGQDWYQMGTSNIGFMRLPNGMISDQYDNINTVSPTLLRNMVFNTSTNTHSGGGTNYIFSGFTGGSNWYRAYLNGSLGDASTQTEAGYLSNGWKIILESGNGQDSNTKVKFYSSDWSTLQETHTYSKGGGITQATENRFGFCSSQGTSVKENFSVGKLMTDLDENDLSGLTHSLHIPNTSAHVYSKVLSPVLI